ncbi:hypothetical protein HDU86_005640 [Geranomyces michiganensis]|nr:hypothetical protein HDU86_005640 [Geranomyces michiganensis]
MASGSSTSPLGIVKAYFPRLARRIHPDLFAASTHNPIYRTTNAVSLQNLNSLISAVSAPASPASRSTLSVLAPGGTPLSFYCKQPPTPLSEPTATTTTSVQIGEFVHITHTITATLANLSPMQMRQRAGKDPALLTQPLFAASFLDLCSKAGIPIAEDDRRALDVWLGVAGTKTLTSGQKLNTQKRHLKDQDRLALRRSFENAMRELDNVYSRTPKQPPPPPRKSRDAVFFSSHVPPASSVDASVSDAPVYVFDKTLTTHQVLVAKKSLRTLPRAVHAAMRAIRANSFVVSTRWQVGASSSGVLVIPWDFTWDELENRLQASRTILRDNDYAFGSRKRSRWYLAEASNRHAKLFVSRDWVVNMATTGVADTSVVPEDPEEDEDQDFREFKDAQQNILSVEVRGERTYEGCFFLATDVSTQLLGREATAVTKWASDQRSSFIQAHWRSMRVNGRPRLFLTYRGLVYALNNSRSEYAENFCDQAARILFAVNLGTVEDRAALVVDTLGLDTVRCVFRRITPAASIVYLINLGTVGELRDSLGIETEGVPNDYVVLKWGYSENLCDRFAAHMQHFGKVRGCQPRLQKAILLDRMQLSVCETEVKNFFELQSKVLRLSGHEILRNGKTKQGPPLTELAAVPPSSIKTVEKFYEVLQRQHGGNYKDIVGEDGADEA